MAPLPTREAFASLLNHTVLDPTFSNAQVIAGLELARRNHVALATVRPIDADLAVRTLKGAATRAAVIAGYPFGFQNTGVKLYEARDLLRRGIREIGVVMAVAQLASREFQHIQTELNQMTEACRAESARLTVYLDTPVLTTELKIIACTCIERAEVDAVAVPDARDLDLLRKHLPDETILQVNAANLEEALLLQSAGVARIATAATAAILDACPPAATPETSSPAGI